MSIYFLRHAHLIKIGFSSAIANRVRAIMTGIPGGAEFLGHFPGDRETEAHLHARFGSQRFNGEWFVESADLLNLIRIVADPELPALVDFNVGGAKRQRTENDEAFKDASIRFRAACAHRWPEANHNDRKKLATALLGWTPRRVKSLYEAQPGCTLRQTELEQLTELLFADAQQITDTKES